MPASGIRSPSADEFDTDPGDLGYAITTDGDPECGEHSVDRFRPALALRTVEPEEGLRPAAASIERHG